MNAGGGGAGSSFLGSCAVSFLKAASARARSRPSRRSAPASLVGLFSAGGPDAVRRRVGDRERARRGGGGAMQRAASSSSVGSRELKGPCRPQAPPSGPRGERGGESDCVCGGGGGGGLVGHGCVRDCGVV